MRIFLSKDDPSQVGAGTYGFLAWFMDIDVLVFYTAETEGDGLIIKSRRALFLNECPRGSVMNRRVGSIVEKKDLPAEVVKLAVGYWEEYA